MCRSKATLSALLLENVTLRSAHVNVTPTWWALPGEGETISCRTHWRLRPKSCCLSLPSDDLHWTGLPAGLGFGCGARPPCPMPGVTTAQVWRMGVLWSSCWVTLVQNDSDLVCNMPHAYQVIIKTRVALPWSYWAEGVVRRSDCLVIGGPQSMVSWRALGPGSFMMTLVQWLNKRERPQNRESVSELPLMVSGQLIRSLTSLSLHQTGQFPGRKTGN